MSDILTIEPLPSKCAKTCQILLNHPETAQVFTLSITADYVAPTESMNFISL